jgi:hypothetical protein
VLCNPAEGSQTLASHCETVHCCADLVQQNKILLVGGGDMNASWPYLRYDNFLPKIMDYEENIQATSRSQEIYDNIHKPYKFLFLNGRTRAHRKYLMERFKLSGLLDQSLWSWLDSTVGYSKNIVLRHNDLDLIGQTHQIKLLPVHYEYVAYRDRVNNLESDRQFVKYELFNNEWGEVYLNAEAYIDTYFSVVTETVFDYPYSFRTEKIWKPMAMAHPWIAVANQGYYKDLHQIGFKTFGNLIDESFDCIGNNTDRLERIAQVVEDLCQQDLASFVKECYNICKYNQQHLAELGPKIRAEFPNQFEQYINERC